MAKSYEDVLKGSASNSNKNVLFQFSKTYPAWIILIVAIGISIGLMFLVEDNIKTENQTRFDKATNSVLTRIQDKYDLDDQILTSINAIFANYVVRDVFELNASTPIKTYPSIRSILKVQKVPKAGFEDFVYNTRSQGYYDMVVRPEADREIYYLTEYVVPFEGNGHISGYDFASDDIAVGFFKEAGKDNKKKVTSVYNVRPDTLGFFFVSPLYQPFMPIETEAQRDSSFAGVLLIEIEPKLFFEEALGDGISSDSSIVFDIFEDKDNGKNVIYSSFNKKDFKADYIPDFKNIMEINVYGHKIKLDFQTIPNFGGKFQEYLPLISLGVGIIVSLILFAFIISVITSRQRALDLAEQMTRSQRRIVDTSQDIIAVLDFNGFWKSMNRASETVFNAGADELVETSINDLFFDEEEEKKFYGLIGSATDDYTERIDLKMKMKGFSKIYKFINWSFTVSIKENMIYAIGRDITLEKEAEKQQAIRNKQVQLAEQFSRETSESKSFFMTQLSHQLRNSLTGILGYLQLVDNKMYDNEEELLNYVKMAELSSEEIFQFVSDIVDITIATDANSKLDLSTVYFKDVFDNVNYRGATTGDIRNIKLELSEESSDAKFVGDKELISETLMMMYKLLAIGTEETTIQVNANDNPYEGAMEVQLLGSENALLERMIGNYKEYKESIIEALEEDEHDILLNLSIVESNIRRLNGSFAIETFGGSEGNVFMVTLPMNQSLKK